MSVAPREPLNRFYLATVLVLMLIVPGAFTIVESLRGDGHLASIAAATGKWFVFWAIGVRLFSAGIRQATKPALVAGGVAEVAGGSAARRDSLRLGDSIRIRVGRVSLPASSIGVAAAVASGSCCSRSASWPAPG
jgi:hypothetical protein